MFKVTLFTGYQFDSQEKAKEFFQFLNHAEEEFRPARYDSYEPIRKTYAPGKLKEPVELLSGAPELRSGEIFLKGAKYKYLTWIRWAESQISEWYFELDERYFNEAERTRRFIQFVADLCKKFPPIYGGAAPQEDWQAKHWLVEEDEEGETETKVGLNVEKCLPGIYWLTILGKPVVDHFGLEKLQDLPTHQALDLGDAGALLVLREAPFADALKDRLKKDNEIIKSLGEKYFFDIRHPQKKCQRLSGVTRPEVPKKKRKSSTRSRSK